MTHSLRTTLVACLSLLLSTTAAAVDAEWTQPEKPFHVYGNTYYVGTHGLSAILVRSSQGLVLIDATLPQNAARIEDSIKALGFRVADVKVILNSHAHFDHAGAIAQLAKDSGARVMASEAGARELRLGGKDPTDPQYGEAPLFAPVPSVDVVADGGVVKLGDVVLTAHYTPGHTPGSTSWTWQSCEAGRCAHMVYADSLGAFAADGYNFSAPAHAQVLSDYRRAIDMVAALPCDILMSPHPGQSDFLERVARRDAGAQPNPLFDGQACRRYAQEGRAKLEARLAKERAQAGAKAAR